MKKYFLLFVAGIIFIGACKKSRITVSPSSTLGTVIGFDQCTVNQEDSTSQGLVIKIQNVSGSDTTIVDTALTYQWPKVFKFHPYLFSNSLQSYLFPKNMRDKYQFTFEYRTTTNDEQHFPACKGTILWSDEYPSQNQIVITKVHNVYQPK